tara:strand:+ start:357 stop:1142 length:786 start_codon:yes stop_codon:yes gene_type:complete
MKHVVMRYMSTRIKQLPYGCPGFGDIVHSVLLTYNYGSYFGEPATLHIATHQFNKDKPETWKQVLDLFPKGSVKIEYHDFIAEQNQDQLFLDFVMKKYPNAELHYYSKYPGKIQKVLQPSFFVDEYMKTYPCLKPDCPDTSIETSMLPEKFVTIQVDAGSKKRMLKTDQLTAIKNYWKHKGYELVTLGGQANKPLLGRATWAGYAMSKARAHIGVDSGYMHLAQCFLKPQDIYIYTNRPWDKWEHHLKMFKDNGVNINEYN